MAPPEHLLMGITLANIFYSVQAFFKKKYFTYGKLLIVLGLVAMSPDIDSFFGRYTSPNPYIGHRGMTHSFVGITVLGFLFTIAASLFSIIIRIAGGYWKFLVNYFT